MIVELYGILRSIAGKKEYVTDASNIPDMLDELARRYGPKMAKYLYEKDAIESLTVVVNDGVWTKPQKKEAEIGNNDIVKLLSPIGGG